MSQEELANAGSTLVCVEGRWENKTDTTFLAKKRRRQFSKETIRVCVSSPRPYISDSNTLPTVFDVVNASQFFKLLTVAREVTCNNWVSLQPLLYRFAFLSR